MKGLLNKSQVHFTENDKQDITLKKQGLSIFNCSTYLHAFSWIYLLASHPKNLKTPIKMFISTIKIKAQLLLAVCQSMEKTEMY